MKKKIIVAVCIVVVAALAFAAYTMSPGYRYTVFLFEARGRHRAVESGKGNVEVCRLLFDPPLIYTGRFVDIPEEARVFGVVLVSKGSASKLVTLCAWDEGEKGEFWGCNGPAPVFAQMEESRQECIEAIAEVLRSR